MKLYLRCLFCLALSVLGPLLSTDSPAFADDHTSRLLEQTYIYDTEGHLKKIVDSSGVASPNKLPKTCGPIDTTTDSQTPLPPTNSIVGRERNPRRSGTEGEDQVIRELEAKGAKVLGREITLQTTAGVTRVDMVIKNAEGGLEVVEVKNGVSARLTPRQQAAFVSIQQSGAEPRGVNATRAGLPVGRQMGPTPVRIIRVVACP